MHRLRCTCLLTAFVLTLATAGPARVNAAQAPAALPPAARDTPQTAASGVLRGRVVAADTGRPVRRAQVRIAGGDLREGRSTDTDANGVYEFTDLTAGRYTLTAVKTGYIQLQYGQQRAFEAGRPVDIRAAQTLEKIDFALPRGSVITGRVLDEFGEPVMDVQVAAMRYQFVRGQRRLAPAGRPATTNDIGEFRLFGLAPGQYYVSATQGSSLMSMMATGTLPDASASRSGYAPTYYPNTPRAGEAQALALEVGQTLNDITIGLAPVRTARISGNVLNSDGQVVTTGTVMAMPKNDPSFNPMAPAMVRPDGTFSLSGLPPGDYSVYAVAMSAPTAVEIATAEVTLSGADVTGVQLMSAKQVTVRGRVVVDAAENTSFPTAAANVVAVPADPGAFGIGSTMPSKINDDLTFEIKTSPGDVLVRLNGAVGQFAIRSVRYRNDEIVDAGLRLKPGEDLNDIEVEVTNKATTLTGAVADAKGQPSKDYSVVVFSQNRDNWRVNTRHIALARPDQEGRFRARIPAGSYYVAALDYLEPGEHLDPAFLDTLSARAATFSISASETRTQDLKLIAHP